MSRLKHSARRSVDRLARPYVDEVVQAVQSAAAPVAIESAIDSGHGSEATALVPSDRFHLALHELRTIELERVDRAGAQVLSVGANGSWYFEWFRRAYGDVDRHVGVEAFEPRPVDLPEYVDWITNTADQMIDVSSGSIDLVFAGQTTEHLWQDELVGFLQEAHRVLRTGGSLVLDSPNRLITERIRWSHGGHSIEISADEVSTLVDLAGFDVVDVAGLWSCVHDGQLLDLETGIDDPSMVVRRATSARDRPDDCFVWWLTARRADREPAVAELDAAVADLFRRHWPARVSRGFFSAPGADLRLDIGDRGRVATTLPFMLHAGVWRGRLRLVTGKWQAIVRPRLVLELPGEHVLFTLELAEDGSFEFELDAVVFAVSLVLLVQDVADTVIIEFPIELHPARD